jgi:two-component system cell cycle response regulator DivK
MEDNKPERVPIDPKEAAVLVVEDSAPNFALIARLLAYTGIQHAEWKTTGWGVIDFAERMPRIDLILMDLRLPHEDGYQVLKQIRAHPRLKDTLVVMVTAHGSLTELDKARAAGFDSYLSKPLNVRRFPDQIRRILQGEQVWDLEV